MTFKSAFKALFRILRRLTFLVLGISLPVFIFPILAGIEGGINFHFWHHHHVLHETNSLTFELEQQASLSYWNVPGAPTIHDFFDKREPFYIPRLTTSDWTNKLGFERPFEHGFEDATSIDQWASLDGLVRDDTCPGDTIASSQYWVYVTSLPEIWRTPWDMAFSTLLEELNVHPLSDDVGIFHLDCAASSFLCGVWSVKKPSLIYFTVEAESLAERKARLTAESHDEEPGWLDGLLEEDFTYSTDDSSLYPVTVRIIELPLENEEATYLLPRTTFPTPLLQLRTLILDPDPVSLLSNWSTYSRQDQLFQRFKDHHGDQSDRRGTWLYYFYKADNWYSDNVLEPIFGKNVNHQDGWQVLVHSAVFTITALTSELVRLPCHWAWQGYAWYFGLGWDGEPVENVVPGEEVGDGFGANMWDDMMAGFWDSVAKNMSAQESENVARAAVTETV